LKKGIIYCVVLSFLAYADVVSAQRIKLSAATLPPIVVEKFHESYPGVHIKSASKITQKKETQYEITFKDISVMKTLDFSEEGKMLSSKEVITADKLPEAVANSVAKKFPNARIMKMWLLLDASQKEYEVELHEKKKKIKMTFSSSGNVLRK
jgi:hypothetical protein